MRICVFSRGYDPVFKSEMETIIDFVQKTKGQLLFYEHMKAEVEKAFSLPAGTVFLPRHGCSGPCADLMLSLGGDGTLLETVNLIKDSGVPVMGVNFGRLGFLSNIPKENLRAALEDFSDGNYSLSGRTVLEIDDCNSIFGRDVYALNDVSLHKNDISTMISVTALINGEFMNNYWSDGLILATPTGSTAYSLSCGGPIMVPEAANFILTPIAPHNLSFRPLVIPDHAEITLIPEGRTDSFVLSLDSNQAIIQRGQKVVIRKASFTINFVRFSDDSFFSVIREKLMWGKDNRNL